MRARNALMNAKAFLFIAAVSFPCFSRLRHYLHGTLCRSFCCLVETPETNKHQRSQKRGIFQTKREFVFFLCPIERRRRVSVRGFRSSVKTMLP
jgi:hypothetical protein